jgi:ABC-type cobalamin transport system ATPase subunit
MHAEIVQFGTALLLNEAQTSLMVLPTTEFHEVLTDLHEQGLTVRLHSHENDTWHIADGGLYSGYVLSSRELIELRRAKKLNIQGIKELG